MAKEEERPATLAECNKQMARMFAAEPRNAQLFTGAEPPDAGHGRAGDLYFCASERAFYYKESETWGEPMFFPTVLAATLVIKESSAPSGAETPQESAMSSGGLDAAASNTETSEEAGPAEGTAEADAGADTSAPAGQAESTELNTQRSEGQPEGTSEGHVAGADTSVPVDGQETADERAPEKAKTGKGKKA